MLALWPRWHAEADAETGELVDVKPFPSKASVNITTVCLVLGSMLSVVAALWQHTAAIAVASVVESIGHGTVMTSIGSTAMTLSWTASVLLVILSFLAYIAKASLEVLDKLTES